jgi:hypothetical protein
VTSQPIRYTTGSTSAFDRRKKPARSYSGSLWDSVDKRLLSIDMAKPRCPASWSTVDYWLPGVRGDEPGGGRPIGFLE